jgi:hypothetical protein
MWLNIILYLFYIIVKELASLHDKHLTRPAFDDSIDEEHAIEIQTQEITQVYISPFIILVTKKIRHKNVFKS